MIASVITRMISRFDSLNQGIQTVLTWEFRVRILVGLFVFIKRRIVAYVQKVRKCSRYREEATLFLFQRRLGNAICLVFESPFVNVRRAITQDNYFPVRQVRIVIVHTMDCPRIRAVSTFKKAPFVPYHFSTIIMNVRVKFMK